MSSHLRYASSKWQKVGDRLSSYILSVGLNGLKEQNISAKATFQSEKEQYIFIGLGTIKEARERVLNSLQLAVNVISLEPTIANLSGTESIKWKMKTSSIHTAMMCGGA
ncbi:hypothetical protein [Paenisporosarcina sp. NPDC076898]|uniref:hypothetical protein n=1 Tax=unclassified Paenisporosarcina TaxID=2642018 RepID=UPI003D0478B4